MDKNNPEESDILLNKSYSIDKNESKIQLKNNKKNLTNNSTILKENEINEDSNILGKKKEKEKILNSNKIKEIPILENKNSGHIRNKGNYIDRDNRYKYYFPWIHLIAFSISFVLLFFSFAFHVEYSNADFSYLINIGENWRLSPMQKIYTSNGNCLKAEDNILNDYWPGLEEGCECDNKILKGECPKNRSDCISLQKYDKIRYAYWQANNLCANKKTISNNENFNLIVFNKTSINKTNKKDFSEILINKQINNSIIDSIKNHTIESYYVNYFDLDISDKNLNRNSEDFCPTDLKNCGIIDSFGNFLCIPLDEVCPINNINIVNHLFKTSFYSNGKLNLKVSSMNNLKLSLLISNSTKYERLFKLTNSEFNFSNDFNPFTSNIPVNFVTSFDMPCKNPFFINSKNNSINIFFLDPFYGKQNCYQYSEDIPREDNFVSSSDKKYNKTFFFEDKFTLIDKYSYRNLLIDNKIYDKFNKIPISFNEQLSLDIGLYARSYYGISAKCHSLIKQRNISDYIFLSFKELKEFRERIIPGVTCIIIFDFFAIGLFIYFFALSMKMKNKTQQELNQENSIYTKLFMIFLWLSLIIILIIAILCLTYGGKLFFMASYLNEIFNKKDCADNFSYNYYTKYFSNINIYSIFLLSIGLSFFIILFIIYLIYTIIFVKIHKIK